LELPLSMGIALLIAILAVSTASVLIRFSQQDAPSLVIAALRISVASIVIAPLALIRYRGELRTLTRPDLALAILSGLFLAVHFASWISSLEYTSVASSVVFVSTGPLWVALVSPLFLKEHLSRSAMVGLALALLGGTIVGLSDACTWAQGLTCPSIDIIFQGTAIWGNILALIGAWAVTGYLVIGRKLRARVSLIPYIFLVYGIAAIALTIMMVTAGQSPIGYRPITYVWIILLALIPQLIGHSTYNWALRYAPATLVATANLGEPVGSAILAYFILRESPTSLTILGAVLILAGIYLASKGNLPKVKNRQTMEYKFPSHLHLDRLQIPYERKSFPPDTEKGAASVARALNFPERQAVKTLIFQVDTGERVLVMLGGDQSAISGNLKKAIGSRNIQMAAPEVVKETTGYVIGSIPPFCWQPDGFRTFLEASLEGEPMLGVGAGQWGEEIFITPENLIRASNAIVVNLTDREKPVNP
jgi:Cys-tRNA(Pro) deacylase